MIHQALRRLLSLQQAGAFTRDKLKREEAILLAKQIAKIAKKHCKRLQVCGSLRRGSPVVGDIDFVVTDCDLGDLLLDLVAKAGATKAPRAGNQVMTVLIPFGRKKIQVEFVSVKDKALGSGMIHSTGSAEFNVGLRSFAKGNGFLLNQHGLFNADTKKWIAGRTEADVFKALGLALIPPKAREAGFSELRDKYTVKPLKAKPAAPTGKVWKVRSSDGTTIYHVTYSPEKGWLCQCKGFIFNHYCSHIATVQKKLEK